VSGIDVPNPDQENVDSDGIGDACYNDTIYGTVSGNVQEGVNINLYKFTSEGEVLWATESTDADGYYAFGNLAGTLYKILPEYPLCGFNLTPTFALIPLDENTSFDFTATFFF
jgi:hypothetical protein